MLNLHRNKINYLIGETKARMTSLSIAIDRPIDMNKMKTVLEKTFDSEPRFSGLYFLNAKGDVTASATELKTKVNLADRSFLQKRKKQKRLSLQTAIQAGSQASRFLQFVFPCWMKRKMSQIILWQLYKLTICKT